MTAAIVATGEVEATWARDRPALSVDVLRAVDAVWERSLRDQPWLVDDDLVSVKGWRADGGQVTLECSVVPYRWFVAVRAEPSLPVPVRPLGVSGVVPVGDGLLVGHRSEEVTEYPGRLELVPSGSVDGRALGADGVVAWRRTLVDELREEAGIDGAELRCLGLVHDADHDVFDIACEVVGVEAWAGPGGEHLDLGVLPLAALLAAGEELVPVSAAIVSMLEGRRSRA